jgi:copper chaperone
MAEVVIRVEGMSCGGCVNSITRALKALPGVDEVQVSLERAEARVHFDAARVTEQALRNAIGDAGFDTPI